jgi:hypothetical protein
VDPGQPGRQDQTVEMGAVHWPSIVLPRARPAGARTASGRWRSIACLTPAQPVAGPVLRHGCMPARPTCAPHTACAPAGSQADDSHHLPRVVRGRLQAPPVATVISLCNVCLGDRTEERHGGPGQFFCSLTWVTPGFHSSLAALESHEQHSDTSDDDDSARPWAIPQLNSGGSVGVQCGLLLDHRVSIIKHDNNCFQVVQGYMAHSADDGGLAEAQRACIAQKHGWTAPSGTYQPLRGRFSTPGFSAGDGCAGFGLMQWQSTTLGTTMGQLSRSRMQSCLLSSLRGFAENDVFDACGWVDPRVRWWLVAPSFRARALSA